jgi:hypothetical protein
MNMAFFSRQLQQSTEQICKNYTAKMITRGRLFSKKQKNLESTLSFTKNKALIRDLFSRNSTTAVKRGDKSVDFCAVSHTQKFGDSDGCTEK